MSYRMKTGGELVSVAKSISNSVHTDCSKS
jgi:hypothetical protein